jgi:hypothetical protein
MPIGRPRCPWGRGFVCIRPIERDRRGVLRQPGRRDGVDLQCFEGNGAKDLGEIGGKERIADVPQPVIMQGGAGESGLQEVEHAPLVQPLPHFVEGMIAIQNRQDQGFDSTSSRQHMLWVGWDETVDYCGNFQAPEHAKNQGQMCERTNLLDSNGHEAPPMVAGLNRIIAQSYLIP